jgi:hypothetical protein
LEQILKVCFLTQQSQLYRRFCPELEDWLSAQQIMRLILNTVKDLRKKDWINTNLIDLTTVFFKEFEGQTEREACYKGI